MPTRKRKPLDVNRIYGKIKGDYWTAVSESQALYKQEALTIAESVDKVALQERLRTLEKIVVWIEKEMELDEEENETNEQA